MKLTVHPLHADTAPPAQFTYPFCYDPHPLCRLAAAQVKEYVSRNALLAREAKLGKMFGVLVVEDAEGRMGFLAAYSGLLADRNDWPWFVPPVYDSQQEDGHFKTAERAIVRLSRLIETLEASPWLSSARQQVADIEHRQATAIAGQRRLMTEAKQRRNLLRAQPLSDEQLADLTRESQHMKAELRRTKQRYAAMLDEAQATLSRRLNVLQTLREERRQMSERLQRWLFSQYVVLNAWGNQTDLLHIFADTPQHLPPSGAGDCCAPKLLQQAFAAGLRPLCMAEFWTGRSPEGAIRRDGQYYPACRGKCLPILTFMLQGLDVESNPLATSSGQTISTVYEDDALAVIVKPAGLLSVEGRTGRESVEAIARRRWAQAEGPLIVHRLDMDTSGLMLIAKTPAAHKSLQAQFLRHEVQKTYVAMLQGVPHAPRQGLIDLPLRPDPMDRPRQVVDREQGREALTRYELLASDGLRTLVRLFPQTGRTHQLRLHCAHAEGLGCPIAGDPLYGEKGRRLMLHAMRISFNHPVSGERMTFEAHPVGEDWAFMR